MDEWKKKHFKGLCSLLHKTSSTALVRQKTDDTTDKHQPLPSLNDILFASADAVNKVNIDQYVGWYSYQKQ